MKETILKVNNVVFGITAILNIVGGALAGAYFGPWIFDGLAAYGVVVVESAQSFMGFVLGLLLSALFVALTYWPFVVMSCIHDRLKEIERNTRVSIPSRSQERVEPNF